MVPHSAPLRALTRLVAGLVVLLSSSVAMAHPCARPPVFEVDGPICPPDRQETPCGCSEVLTWDPVASADWYEVHRCNVEDGETGECRIVGDTRWRNRGVTVGPNGSYHAEIRPEMWLVAWDQPFPAPLRVYDYAVTACRAGSNPDDPICSANLSNWVRYGAAPYMCVVIETL